MSENRDNFSGATKRVLSERVNSACSNPNCRASTRGPSSDDVSSVNLGCASHIHGAAPGAERYVPEQDY
jgi:hypothetical protein